MCTFLSTQATERPAIRLATSLCSLMSSFSRSSKRPLRNLNSLSEYVARPWCGEMQSSGEAKIPLREERDYVIREVWVIGNKSSLLWLFSGGGEEKWGVAVLPVWALQTSDWLIASVVWSGLRWDKLNICILILLLCVHNRRCTNVWVCAHIGNCVCMCKGVYCTRKGIIGVKDVDLLPTVSVDVTRCHPNGVALAVPQGVERRALVVNSDVDKSFLLLVVL